MHFITIAQAFGLIGTSLEEGAMRVKVAQTEQGKSSRSFPRVVLGMQGSNWNCGLCCLVKQEAHQLQPEKLAVPPPGQSRIFEQGKLAFHSPAGC